LYPAIEDKSDDDEMHDETDVGYNMEVNRGESCQTWRTGSSRGTELPNSEIYATRGFVPLWCELIFSEKPLITVSGFVTTVVQPYRI